MGKCTQGKRPAANANGQPFLFSFDSNFESVWYPVGTLGSLWLPWSGTLCTFRYLLDTALGHAHSLARCCHLAVRLQLVITCVTMRARAQWAYPRENQAFEQ